MDAQTIRQKAQDAKKQNKALVAKLKRLRPRDLDATTHALHEEAFEQIDCLDCANCCKTTSPIFRRGDIDRLARTLKMSSGQFIETYLRLDEEDDYVLQGAPCPFLGADNKCIVYEHRPNACREYPHTDRKRFYQILPLSLKNTAVCPAVQHIFEQLRQRYE
mgnify:CR=1 FL=1